MSDILMNGKIKPTCGGRVKGFYLVIAGLIFEADLIIKINEVCFRNIKSINLDDFLYQH